MLVQNIQSIKNKQHILESYLDENEYHYICLTETWIREDQKNTITVNNYQFADAYYRHDHRGGGVAILLRDGIEYKSITAITDMSIECTVECCAVEVVKHHILLITIYRPDRDIEVFFKVIENILDLTKLKYSSKQIIICGDFNINSTPNTIEYTRLVNLMLENNLQQIVMEPTRETSTTSTCIDLLFTNHKQYELKVKNTGISDHKSVVYTQNVTCTQTLNANYHTTKRIFNDRNIEKFKNGLSQVDFISLISENHNIDKNYNDFANVLQTLLAAHIPKKRINIKQNKRNTYLTNGLKRSCQHKRLLKIIVDQNKNIILKKHYKIYEKTLKKCVNQAKKINNIKLMKSAQNKSKTMWKIIKNSNTPSQTIYNKNFSLNYQNNITNCPSTIANVFNDYFASIGESTQNVLPRSCPVLAPSINSLFVQPTTEREISNIINNMSNKRSFGVDDIPPLLIKACSNELTPPLTKLINISLTEGKFPEKLKYAKIIPIYKKGGNALEPSAYRPIALLPSISKIFEKVMANRIYTFLEKYELLDVNQYGFRQKRSTTLATYNYVQKIYSYLNQRQCTLGLFLDMSKAYDNVSHNLLLQKIYGLGIRDKAYEWLKTYLKDRKQFVQVQYYDRKTNEIYHFESHTKIVNNSIPQGSVLGCILFLMYINDLPKIIQTPCVLFADDVSLLFQCNRDIRESTIHVENSLKDITFWLREHNLEINLRKTKIVQFRPYQRKALHIDELLKQLNVAEVSDFTLLGITLDSNLNWKKHIEKLKSKMSKFIYAFSKLKASTNVETALTMYYAYAYAWFNYGIVLWGESTDFNDLFILQKKCVRILCNIRQRESCFPHFIANKILTLPSLYVLQCSMFVRNHRNLFKSNNEININYNRRYKNKLITPAIHLELMKKSPDYRICTIYNKLPEHIKNEEKNTVFYNKLKMLLIKKAYYTVDQFKLDNF